MNNNSTIIKHYFILMALISSFILGYALIVEHLMGYEACLLCLYQRLPYIAILIISLAAVKIPRVINVAYKVNIVILIISFLLGTYHSGVEKGFFEGPQNCSNNLRFTLEQSFEDIKNIIYNTNAVSCRYPNYNMLGLSMASWNMAASLILLLYTIYVSKKYKTSY